MFRFPVLIGLLDSFGYLCSDWMITEPVHIAYLHRTYREIVTKLHPRNHPLVMKIKNGNIPLLSCADLHLVLMNQCLLCKHSVPLFEVYLKVLKFVSAICTDTMDVHSLATSYCMLELICDRLYYNISVPTYVLRYMSLPLILLSRPVSAVNN